jgi:undecaprenyl-diphosphatase
MPGSLAGVLSWLDVSLFRWILVHRSPLLDHSMIALSHGGGFVWLGLAVLMGFVRRNHWGGVFQVALAIGLAALLSDTVVKPLVGRHRPYVVDVDLDVIAVREKSASFPSTHAANAMAAAYAISRAFPEVRAVLWLLALLVAFSRVYVGVHYPLDVIGGALIGLAAAAFVVGGTRVDSGSKKAVRSRT